MSEFHDAAAASRARMAAYDAEHARDRSPRRRTRARDERARRDGLPFGDRRAEDRARIEAIHARRPGHPLGTIAEPLPMGPYKSPFRMAAWKGER